MDFISMLKGMTISRESAFAQFEMVEVRNTWDRFCGCDFQFLKANVTRVLGNGRYSISLENSDYETEVQESDMRKISYPEYEQFDTVETLVRGEWATANVTRKCEDVANTYDLELERGESKEKIHASNMRKVGADASGDVQSFAPNDVLLYNLLAAGTSSHHNPYELLMQWLQSTNAKYKS